MFWSADTMFWSAGACTATYKGGRHQHRAQRAALGSYLEGCAGGRVSDRRATFASATTCQRRTLDGHETGCSSVPLLLFLVLLCFAFCLDSSLPSCLRAFVLVPLVTAFAHCAVSLLFECSSAACNWLAVTTCLSFHTFALNQIALSAYSVVYRFA